MKDEHRAKSQPMDELAQMRQRIAELEASEAQRKRVEAALRLASTYNRSLIEASLDPLVTIDVQGKITDVNAATEKAIGCAREELIGTDFLDYFTEPERARAGYQQVFREGTVQDYALEIRHRDGHVTPVLYNASVYRDETGGVIGVFAAARDITQRKRAEAALERRVTELNALYAMTAIVNESLNVDEVLSRAMDEALRLVGAEAAAILLLDPEVGELTMAAHRGVSDEFVRAFSRMKLGEGLSGRVAQTGQPAVMASLAEYPGALVAYVEKERIQSIATVPLVGRTGVIGVMNLAATSPHYFDSAGLELLMALGQQIAVGVEKARLYEETRAWAAELERRVKERTAALSESEHKFRETVTYLDEGYYSCMVDGVLLEHNLAFNRILGFELTQDLKGARLPDFWQDPNDRREYLNELMTNGVVRNHLINAKTIGGEGIVVMANSHLVKDREDRPVRIEGIFTDITERKQAADRIAHLNAVLRAIRDVNQLIAKEKDRDALLQGACQNLIETRGYGSAWIALLDESGKLITSAEAGMGEGFASVVEPLTRGELPECGRRALAQPDVWATDRVDADCPHCPLARGYPDRGGMTARLEHGGKVYGFMTVSVPSPLVMDEEEKRLFREVSADIAFALYGLEMEAGRQRAEEALRENEERFRSLYENATIGLYRTTPDGRILMANPAAVRMLGFHSFEELAQRNLEKEGYEPSYPRDQFREQVERDGLVTGFESTWVNRDGASVCVRESARAVRAENGKVLYYDGTFEDITERKRAEESLRASEERFRIAAESASDLIWEWDIRSGQLAWFGAIDALLGYAPGEFPRTIDAWEAIIHPAEHDRVMAMLDQHLKTRAPYVEEYRVRRKDGTLGYWTDKGEAIRDEKGSAYKMIGVCTDITGRKQAEEQLRRRAEELERINAELERFNRLAVGRELRMIELKRQVNELAEALGKTPPYDLSFAESL